ncbi:MAG: efflux RND transporter periplasmic adaptor subunit [Candidatus Saganbacteria bacterium]|nr:efflux RND transporter periplasmic adaptor subunit [Candidatus Saganbacteria bacterium]
MLNILKNKKVVIGIAIASVIILAFIIMRVRAGGVEIKVAKVERGNVLSTVSAAGEIKADSVDLGSAKMAGRVEWIGVSEGDRVRRGQILVKLDGYDQARKEYFRLKELHAKGFVSDLDLERAKTAMDNSAVMAPISGIVTDKAVTVGEAVSPGMPVMTVVDVDNPWVEIQLDEVDIGDIAVGQRVKLTTDAYPDSEFYGKITWVNDKAELKKVGNRVRMDEEDLVFRSKVVFENGSQKLRPGMTVYSQVITGEKKDVLVVPRTAITLSSGNTVVYRLSGKRVKEQMVEVGSKDPEKVEIVSGLKQGDSVAISNLTKLTNGQRIKIIKNGD